MTIEKYSCEMIIRSFKWSNKKEIKLELKKINDTIQLLEPFSRQFYCVYLILAHFSFRFDLNQQLSQMNEVKNKLEKLIRFDVSEVMFEEVIYDWFEFTLTENEEMNDSVVWHTYVALELPWNKWESKNCLIVMKTKFMND